MFVSHSFLIRILVVNIPDPFLQSTQSLFYVEFVRDLAQAVQGECLTCKSLIFRTVFLLVYPCGLFHILQIFLIFFIVLCQCLLIIKSHFLIE